jgi:2-methylcitrate dehydratase PrpD
MATYSERFAKFVVDTQLDDVPREVIEDAKDRVLDHIGVVLPAYDREMSAKIAVKYAKSLGGPEESTIFIVGGKVPAVSAALANGVMGHSLELDDDHNIMIGHPGVPVIPACLAVAEREKVDGKQFLLSVILGYEGVIRTSMAVKSGINHFHHRGFHSTGTNGVFGSAAATAKLTKLDVAETTSALGLAAGFSSGLLEGILMGFWTKRLNAGWAAHSGITAAKLAKLGFNSPKNMFEGSNGWYSAYACEGNYDLDQITNELGKRYEIINTSYKPYSCCRYCHGPIDAAWGAMANHKIDQEDLQNVESIEVRTVREAERICANPVETKKKPNTDVDAQFSIYYAVAVAMLYGKPGTTLLDYFDEKTRNDSKVLELASKIRVNQDPELEKTYPRLIPASINIRMKDGEEYFYKVDTPKGDPEWQLTREELKTRFQDLAGRVFNDKQVEEIYDEVYNLESAKDISKLIALCVRSKK